MNAAQLPPDGTGPARAAGHAGERHHPGDSSKLNWLRAGVLGANDGVVATSGLVIGVAAAGTSGAGLFTAGMAGLAAGALSMGVGEYVSVSTQRDTEGALLAKERRELADSPEAELRELVTLYQRKGLSEDLAQQVAEQLTAHDALAAHAEVELRLDPEELTNPWHAAGASMLAFTLGSVIPLATILLVPGGAAIWATIVAAAAALWITGHISARLGGAPLLPAVLRNVGGGLVAMAVTFAIGSLVGARIE